MTLSGLPVVVDELALRRVWVFPRDRFIEYGPEDEGWCRALGLGREESRPGAFLVNGTLVVHPAAWEALKVRLGGAADQRRAGAVGGPGGPTAGGLTADGLRQGMDALRDVGRTREPALFARADLPPHDYADVFELPRPGPWKRYVTPSVPPGPFLFGPV